MTHPTDEELDALIAAINHSTRDPETGNDLFPGSYVHLSVEDAIAAAIAIISLRHHNVEARHLMHMRHQEMLTADGLMRKHQARADRAEAALTALRTQLAEVQADLTFMTENRNKWQDSATQRWFRIEEAEARADRAEQRVATLEAALAAQIEAAIREMWCLCEDLEDEAYAKLKLKLTEHEQGFWTAQKMTAKRIRRATQMPTNDRTALDRMLAAAPAAVAPSLRITGPNSDGEYWLHIKAGGRYGGVNLGGEHGPICKQLLDAASETGAKE